MSEYKKINLNILNNHPRKVIKTEEALRDVEPFYTEEEVISFLKNINGVKTFENTI